MTSGYDFKKKFSYPPFQYIETEKNNFGDLIEPPKEDYGLDGLKSQAYRLGRNGGINQQERMIFDKRRSLDRALLYSYQAADISKVQCVDDEDNSFRENIIALDEHEVCRALINPDKNKLDYDDKIVSMHFEENFHPGDVFEWLGTKSYWIILLQDLTEVAYFRGEIRRCLYEISWEDEELHRCYAAVRGPVETKINYIQKHGISVDRPNYSLTIYMPRSEASVKYFARYSKFYLQGLKYQDVNTTCWRVEAVDAVSTVGILEIHAVEYYSNDFEDDIEEGIAGGLKVKPISPNTPEEDEKITGEVFIRPKQIYDYYCNEGKWSILEGKKIPVKMEVNSNDSGHVRLRWEMTYSGKFTLVCGDYKKEIIVESLF